MPKWIDLALLGSEPELERALAQLDPAARDALIDEFAAVLQTTTDELKRGWLRLLVERARPLALPASLWARSLTASTDIEAMIRAHLARHQLEAAEERLRLGQALYVQFVDERDNARVTKADLDRQNYRCGHCGLAFCNEELADKPYESPHGSRGVAKRDGLKRHWHRSEDRKPTLDHDWPVSLYGDNGSGNLRVLCRGCNEGKQQFLVWQQMRGSTGRPNRKDLLGVQPVSHELFYEQLRRMPRCVRTQQDARTTELTIVLRDPDAPPVLDNLLTVESPGL